MTDRLFVSVLAERNGGKSTTWNHLFGSTVRRGKHPRSLEVLPKKCVEVFLVSGSFEERQEYAGDVLDNQHAKIILCSVQYVEKAWDTFNFVFNSGFSVYTQWLNPGFHDPQKYFDRLGFANRLLHKNATLSIRNGQDDPAERVAEIRDFILGWAQARALISDC